MKKNFWFALLVTILFVSFTSCDSGESYADKLKKERRLIGDLIAEKGVQVIEGFPSDGKFDANIYYKDPSTGLYLNIVSYGDTTKMAKTGSQILYRFDKYKILTDTAYYDFSGNAIGQSQSDLLIYGNTGTYISSSSSATSTNDYLFRSPACMMALKYIGKGGKFNVIIPFDEEVSSAYQQDYYLTLYLENVTYTMID